MTGTAQDAIDSVVLEIEPLDFTVDPLESLYPGGPDARENGNNVGGGRSGLDPHQVKWTARDFAAVEEGQLPFGEPAVGWSYGDVEGGLAEAALVYDESFTTQGNSHHSMEPRTAMAWWENGKCYVHAGCQSLTATLTSLARQCGVELENLVYVNEFCGGGFGSKGTAAQTAGIAARLSRKIDRPVLLRISRAEEFYIGSARGTFQGRARIGFRADGRIMAIDFSVVQDGGGNGGFGGRYPTSGRRNVGGRGRSARDGDAIVSRSNRDREAGRAVGGPGFLPRASLTLSPDRGAGSGSGPTGRDRGALHPPRRDPHHHAGRGTLATSVVDARRSPPTARPYDFSGAGGG